MSRTLPPSPPKWKHPKTTEQPIQTPKFHKIPSSQTDHRFNKLKQLLSSVQQQSESRSIRYRSFKQEIYNKMQSIHMKNCSQIFPKQSKPFLKFTSILKMCNNINTDRNHEIEKLLYDYILSRVEKQKQIATLKEIVNRNKPS